MLKHFITFLRFACQFFGFCLSNINIAHLGIDYRFKNKIIFYSQSPLTATHNIDTENRKTEYVTVSGCEAFLSYDDNSSIIVWNDGNYVYSINGDLCKNDIIEMANSVNPTK